jgi:hypothetical protein
MSLFSDVVKAIDRNTAAVKDETVVLKSIADSLAQIVVLMTPPPEPPPIVGIDIEPGQPTTH